MTPKLVGKIEAGRALDTDPAHIDEAWDKVIDGRVEDILNGKAELADGREPHARVRSSFKRGG